MSIQVPAPRGSSNNVCTILSVGVRGQLPFINDDWALGAAQAKSEAHSAMNNMRTISEKYRIF